MIYTFRNILKILLSLNLVFSPAVSYADDDPMDMAQDAVHESLRLASGKALAAVKLDMANSIADVLNEMYSQDTPSAKDRSQKLFTEQASLLEGFNKISELNPEEVVLLKSQVQEAYDGYKELIRNRFDASFILPQYEYDARKSIVFASRALQNFEARCESGRGIGGNGIPALELPGLPKPSYSLGFSVGNSSENSLDANYTGTGSHREKIRNDLMNTSNTVVGLTTNIAVFGAEGAVTSFCQAAMPYAWGAGIAIVAIAMYLSHAERVKAEDRLADAQIYAFANAANDEDVGDFYKEHCRNMSEKVADVRLVLDKALADPQGLEKLSASFGNVDQELKEYQEKVKAREQLKQELSDLLAERSSQDQPDESLNKKIKVKYETLKAAGKEISESADGKKIAGLVAKIVLTREAEIKRQFGTLAWTAVDQAQKRAFSNIVKVFRLLNRKNFNRYLGNGSGLQMELAAKGQFETARLEFKKLLALKIKYIFGRVSRDQLISAREKLQLKTNSLMDVFGHDAEIFNFASQVKSLVKGI